MRRLKIAFLLALSLQPLAMAIAPPPAGQDEDAAAKAAAVQAQREADFAKLLSGATLEGNFTADDAPDQAPAADRYTLGKVNKHESGQWRFEAKIAYGGREFVMPLLLDVEWAGDTPVITLTDRKFPLMGTFTARVLFHDSQYVGIWKGTAHGGQMWGRVIPAADGDGEGTESAPDKSAGAADEDGGHDTLSSATSTSAADALVAVADPQDQIDDGVNWPSFRGPGARGQMEGTTPPATWNVETGENVLFRVEVPGLAHSSPVIWEERVYLTTAVRMDGEAELKVGLYGSIGSVKDEGEHGFLLLCFDKVTGEMLWEQECWSGQPKFERHPKSSFAVSSPATNGDKIVAFFGTEGLYCFNSAGELQWEKDLGDMSSGFYRVHDAQWGFASSPIIHGDKVIVQVDIIGESFLAMLDLETGEEIWRTARTEEPTWSSPTVHVGEQRSQIICNGWKHIGGYDLATGRELWNLEGTGDIPVPTPVVAHGLIYITTAHGRGAPIYAIDCNAEGDLSAGEDGQYHESVIWSKPRRGNYMQTPLVYGDELYMSSDAGILRCYDARTGEEHYAERLGAGGSGFSGSGVATGGLLYFTSEEGEVTVVGSGTTFDIMAKNSVGEECMSTPAISEGVIYWRTRGHLVAIGAE